MYYLKELDGDYLTPDRVDRVALAKKLNKVFDNILLRFDTLTNDVLLEVEAYNSILYIASLDVDDGEEFDKLVIALKEYVNSLLKPLGLEAE